MSRPVPLVAGVDGCPIGWVAVVGPITGSDPWMTVASDFATLVDRHPRVAQWAVDIPIGLADSGPRECDSLARKELGPKRGSSVFPAPPRLVAQYIEQDSVHYPEACRIAAQATGKKISKQAWNITPKIAEVRRFLIGTPRWRDRVFESHPELAFARLAGGKALLEGKKTTAGALRRRQLLNKQFGAEYVTRLITQTESTCGVAINDTLDAMACWTAAARAVVGRDTALPTHPPRDADGLSLAIRW